MKLLRTVVLVLVALALVGCLYDCSSAGTAFITVSTTAVAPVTSETGTTEAAGPQLYRIMANKKYGYMDRGGKVVIPARYAHAESFSEGLACVVRNQSGSAQRQYIGRSGNVGWAHSVP